MHKSLIKTNYICLFHTSKFEHTCLTSTLFVNYSRQRHLHLIQLFIDFLVILIVFTKLGDQGPVSQREQLGVLRQRKQQNTLIIRPAQN